MNTTVEFFETVFLSEKCEVSKVITMVEVQSFGHDTGPQSFCYLFSALSITRYSKSAQKFAVRVCQVATVVIATMQLVLSQLKKLFTTSIKN